MPRSMCDGPRHGRCGFVIFYTFARCCQMAVPRVVLENVDNINTQDGGNTLRVIQEVARTFGYEMASQVVYDIANLRPMRRRRWIALFTTVLQGPTRCAQIVDPLPSGILSTTLRDLDIIDEDYASVVRATPFTGMTTFGRRTVNSATLIFCTDLRTVACQLGWQAPL